MAQKIHDMISAGDRNNGSRGAAATGAIAPMPVSLPSMATTPAAIATPTTDAVPLSVPPDDDPRFADRPEQRSKGSASPDETTSKDPNALPRPIPAGDELFLKAASFRELHRAWRRARAGKRDNAAVQRFGYDLEANLIQLQNELIWQTWQPGPYEQFVIREPKRRDIFAPAFRDRIVHHSLYATLAPIFERSFLARSYACRVNKGTHKGADKAQQIIRKKIARHKHAYCLKADISQYFASIHHRTLKKLIRRRVTSPGLLRLCDLIIRTSPGANKTGIPLGNLTSQLFANIYLHELDHYVANILRLRGYVRYMDDFILVSHEPKILKRSLTRIRKFLTAHLRLKLNPKTAIFPISSTNGRAVDFLGYRIYATHRRLRRKSVLKGRKYARALAKETSNENLARLTSWYAHARHAEPTGLMREIFQILSTEGGAA